MIFSEKLQLLRTNKGITQEELANTLQVSRQAVAKWESGTVYPDILNLIRISNFFHMTIDFLVKDSQCSANIEKRIDGDIERLIAFRLEANKNTYAGDADLTEASRLNSHDYKYEKGEYLYYDTWLGGEKFSGEEAIWLKEQAIYAMNYFGRVLDEKFSGDFLKLALREATVDFPCRGPALFEVGEYTYKTQMTGDIEWFFGFEEIFYRSEKVYECHYHGGTLI